MAQRPTKEQFFFPPTIVRRQTANLVQSKKCESRWLAASRLKQILNIFRSLVQNLIIYMYVTPKRFRLYISLLFTIENYIHRPLSLWLFTHIFFHYDPTLRPSIQEERFQVTLNSSWTYSREERSRGGRGRLVKTLLYNF